MNEFMKIAINEAMLGLKNNAGGPFGAVIVKNGIVIAKAHNTVIKDKDPTCHAEINVIKMASKILKRFDLSDCEIYSSCEPCPMCLSAVYWAKIKKLYYGSTREDAAKIGFDDKYIYDVINGNAKEVRANVVQVDRDICLKPFHEWEIKKDKISY
jgi:guanine deaminase